MPNRSSFSLVTLPTPNIRLTASVFTKPSTLSGVITNCPFGLFKSLATFARNLLGATPAEAVTPTSSAIIFRISSAINVALP